MAPQSAAPTPPATASEQTASAESRFFGLDSVRAVAMLLGVLYHAIMFGGGMFGGFGGGSPSAANRVMDWIHSFRMPLFFLISGFFCNMMFRKYGLGKYLSKRWVRIFIPFLLVLGVLAGIRSMGGGSGFPGGGPGRGGPRPGPGPGGPAPFAQNGEMPAPPPGFVPPFLARFDKDKDGSLSTEEWKEAQAEMKKMFEQGPPGGGPGMGPQGGPGRGPAGGPGMQGPPGGGGGFRGGPMGFGQSNPMAEKLFGDKSRNFNLAHLWFLWYLLVFATAAPFFAMAAAWVTSKIGTTALDRSSASALRWGWAPLVLAAASVIGMVLAGSSPGRAPGGMQTIFGVFPDVLFKYDPDWPYFFTYFLAGWWLFRYKAGLNDISRLWLPILAIGFSCHIVANHFANPNPFGGGPSPLDAATLGKFLVFGISSAFTGFGLMAFFQRYLNRPTKVSRYLADTAFWIYLVHQDLLNMVVIPLVSKLGLPTLPQAIITSLVTCLIALIAFELVIRRTPLTNLFGPPRRKKTPAIPTGTNPA